MCRLPRVQCGGKKDPAWVICFVDDAISVDVDGVTRGRAYPSDGGGKSGGCSPSVNEDDDTGLLGL